MTALTLGSYPYVEDYLDVLLRHGRKPVTIIRYRYVLDRILREMEELGLPTNPHEISEDNIYEIFASIKVGDDSKSSYCTILKQWLRFHTNNAAESVRLMLNPPARENVRWVTDDDISLSISASLRPQDKVILHLGSAYGLRRGEIATLKVDDLHRDHMIVHGKGHGDDGKIRKVPLLPNDGDLRRYLDWRQRTVAGCLEDRSGGALLIVCIKRTVRAVTPEWVGRRARSSFVNVGVDGTTHSLRRAFITEAYDAGARIVDIMHIVGHESYDTTADYIRTDGKKAEKVMVMRNSKNNHYISGKAF
ncbi:MAG: site-specific integrase [Methanoculleus sp.]